MIPVNRPYVNEADINFVTNALKEMELSGESTYVKVMESRLAEYLNVEHAVAVSNGSTAIDLVINAMDIKKDNVVVAPTFTIVSSVSQILRNGARLHLVDSDPITWSMDAEACKNAIDEKISLVMAVHIYGLPVDLDTILEASSKYTIPVIEDAAEALGLEYKGKKCGSIGTASTFSFYANKIVTGGEGGAICTNDGQLASKLRVSRNLNFSPIERYVHEDVGFNSRIHGLSAALIASQMNRISELRSRKIQIADLYRELLKSHPWFDIQTRETGYSANINWVVGILLNEESPLDATNLQKKLRESDIDTRRFFCPIHLQPFASKYNVKILSNMHVSENLWRRGLYLPAGLGISEEEVYKVCEELWKLARG